MRYVLLLVTLWLSVAGGAEPKKQEPPKKGGPWEKDWAVNAGDCVVVGEMPRGVSCKLYAHGSYGFEMRIYIYDEAQSRLVRAEKFLELGERLCSGVGTSVRIEFHAPKLPERVIGILPPDCKKPITE